MLELLYENDKGDVLNINQGDIRALSIDGISPECRVNTSSIAGYDGATVISSQTPMRNIVIVLDLRNDFEVNRQQIYNIFRIKKAGTFYFKSDTQQKKISCITEKVSFNLEFSETKVQISLLCPQPYFTATEPNTKLMSAITPLFRFPFHFNGAFRFSEHMASVIENFVNDSSVEVYPVIELLAKTSLENPSIMNINTYEKAKVNISLNAGDKVIIDTRKGYKNITLIRNGVESDIFNLKADDFRFFKLYVGDNWLKYDADVNSAGLQTTIKWESLYGGV